MYYTSILVTYMINKYSKVLNGDAYGTQLQEVSGTKWWDVLGTSAGCWSYMFSNFNSQRYKTLIGYSRVIVNGSSEKFSEQYSG